MANTKRKDTAEERFAKAKLLYSAGLKPSEVQRVLGCSSGLASLYRKFDTFDGYQQYNKEKAREQAVAKDKVEQSEQETTEADVKEPEQVYDPLARKMILDLQQELADIKERLEWVERNAVIDTSHKNRSKLFRRN